MQKSTIGSGWKARASGLQRGSLLALAVASTLAVAGTARAGEAPESALEEIIVTAERRATTENTTAISMNVLTADDLASTQTKTIADLQASTPNVTINSPGGFNSINIRGIGNSAIQPTIQVGVAVLQDGLLNAETVTLGNQFLDLGTVEVLRGPQGTFIGTSATGGAIRLNSVKPSLTDGNTGYIEALVGNSSDTKVTGAMNLPISDTFAARIAFNAEKRNSYFYNRGSVVGIEPTNPHQRPGSVDDMNARLSLLWAPNDSLEVVWRSEMNRSDSQGSHGQPNPRTFINALGQPTHSRYWNYDAPADPSHDPEVLSHNQLDTQFATYIDRHSLEVNYKFANDITLRSLTGFQHSENVYTEDGDSSFANANTVRNDVGPDNNYYSQEFNLISPDGPFNWIVGASWFYRMTPPNVVIEESLCGISPSDGSSTPCKRDFSSVPDSILLINQRATVRSGGVYGQINWEFVPDLELTVGARYNVDRNFSRGPYPLVDGDGVIPVIAPPVSGFLGIAGNCPANLRGISRYSGVIDWSQYGCLLGNSTGGPVSYEDENPTWKVGLNWTPGDNNFFYVFYARGYKAGGAQPSGEFKPETVDDYELGWKGTFLDGRATLSLGGFYMDYQDMQQQAYRATTTSRGDTSVTNVGSATIQGIEAEFNAKLGGLGIQANVGWVDSELGDIRLIDRSSVPDSLVSFGGADVRQCAAGEPVTLGTCFDYTSYYRSLSGATNIFSPELSYGVTLDYEIASGNGTWTPRVSFSHVDEQDVNLIRREDFWQIPKRDLTNVSLTYAQGDWTAQAFVNNAADKTYIAAIGTGGGLTNDTVVYGTPRTYGIRFRRNF